MLDAAGTVTSLHHRVRLTAAVRDDLQWWHTFLPRWNGTFPIVPPRAEVTADAELATDSSRTGAGACHEGRWWSLTWPDTIAQDPAPSMTFLEMIPVLLSCVMWGHLWTGKRILVYSDNMGVVGSWGRGWAREPRTMAMIRHLLFLSAAQCFLLDIQYISTKANGAADALSRGDIVRFRRLRPAAREWAETLPAAVDQFLTEPVAGLPLLTGVQL